MKGQLRISSTLKQSHRLKEYSLFLVVNAHQIILSQLRSQLCAVWKMINLLLRFLPWCCQCFLEVACAKSLPVQQVARCQVKKQKHIQAESRAKVWKFSQPNSPLLSFPTSPPQTRFAFLALGILTLTLHFSNKVSPKQTCLHLFPAIMKNLSILFFLPNTLLSKVLGSSWKI